MKDSIAGIAGTIGAGAVQLTEMTGIAPDTVSTDTLTSSAIH